MKIKQRRTLTIAGLFIALSVSLMSCVDSTDTNSTPSINTRISQFNELSTLKLKLAQTGLDSTISKSASNYILLSPTNDAFTDLGGMLDTLSTEQLKEVLSYHLIEGGFDFAESVTEDSSQSYIGEYLYFHFATSNSDTSKVNNKILYSGYGASNGAIYPVNKVLLPDKYSTVKGLISKRFQLSELYNALKQADLRNTLGDNSQSYTVFAPSDRALRNATLPSGTSALQAQLKYHIVPQKLTSAQLAATTDSIETLNGDKISVSSQGGTIMINGQATVTKADISGANGIVHIIDGVLEDN